MVVGLILDQYGPEKNSLIRPCLQVHNAFTLLGVKVKVEVVVAVVELEGYTTQLFPTKFNITKNGHQLTFRPINTYFWTAT